MGEVVRRRGGRIWEVSVPSTQLCCEPKLPQKEVYKKIQLKIEYLDSQIYAKQLFINSSPNVPGTDNFRKQFS